MKSINLILILFSLWNSNARAQNGSSDTTRNSPPDKILFSTATQKEAKTIKYGLPFFATFTPVALPSNAARPEDFTLIINNRHFPQYSAKQFFIVDGKIQLMFVIDHSIGDNTNLAEFLGKARNDDPTITIEIVRASERVTKIPGEIKIEFYTDNGALIVTVFSIAIIVLLVFLAIKSNLLKEPVTAADLQLQNEPAMRWSLGKTQLAVWTMTIAVLYLMIWIITYSVPTINDTVLALLGISFATTAVGSAQPSGKFAIAKVKTNFFLDLIDDGNGASIHRFQNVVFLGVFVSIFIGTTYSSLEFPTFDTTQLLLLGISSAGYLGMKFLKEK